MAPTRRPLRALSRDDRAATSVEYGLICALIFLAMVGGVQTFGTSMVRLLNKVSSTVVTAG